jgi:putative esterase
MTTSKSWALVIAGYSVFAVAMLAFLTVNGVSAPAAGTIGTAGLIVLGLLLPAAGMLELARCMDPPQGTARKGLVLQSLSLTGLLIGLLVSYVASSLSGYLVSGVVIVLSGTAGLAGAIFISNQARARQLVVAAALIAIGAALIPAANIALSAGWLVDIDKNIYMDIGATVAGCGSVVAAYSFFGLRSRGKAPVAARPLGPGRTRHRPLADGVSRLRHESTGVASSATARCPGSTPGQMRFLRRPRTAPPLRGPARPEPHRKGRRVMWLPKLAFPGDRAQAIAIRDPAPCRRRLPAVFIAVALPVAGLAGCSSSAPAAPVNTQEARILHLTIDSRLVHGPMPLTLVTSAGGGAHRPVLVVLHGLHSLDYDNNSQLTDQMFAALHALGPLAPDIAFPYGDDSYWANSPGAAWASYVLDEVIPGALTVLHADPSRVAIGGISMGGYGAYEIARADPGRFCAVGGHSAPSGPGHRSATRMPITLI